MESKTENKWCDVLVLLGLSAVFLALRLGVLLTSVESVTYGTEIDLGTIARELIRGLRVPFSYFQMDNYSGESFVLGPMAVPFFKIFGPTLFAIKMVPLFFSFLTLLMIYIFVRRHFGGRAAFCSALLFVFAPPGVVQFSLVGLAAHSEAVFFGIVIVACFFEFFREYSRKWLIIFGLVSGFSTWFFYAQAITALSCLVFLGLTNRWRLARSMPLFLLSFLAGFSPWIIGNLNNHFLGVFLLKESTAGFHLSRMPQFAGKLARLLFLDLPSSLATIPVPFIPLRAFKYIYYLVLLSPLLFFRASRKIAVFVIFTGLYIAALVFSSLEIERGIGFIGYRYLAPVWIMTLVAMGIAMENHELGKKTIAVIVAFGLFGQAGMLYREPFGRAFLYKGYSYYQLGTKWQLNLNGTFKNYADFQRVAAVFPEQERRMLVWGIAETTVVCGDGSTLFDSDPRPGTDLSLDTMREREPAPYYPFTYVSLGASSKRADAEFLEKIPEAARKYFCAGRVWKEDFQESGACDLRQIPSGPLPHPDSLLRPEWGKLREKIDAMAPEKRQWAYRGAGRALGAFSDAANPQFVSTLVEGLPEIPAENLTDVYWGMGWQTRESFKEDKRRALDWIDRFPAEGRAAAREGLESFDQWYGVRD